MDDTERIKDLFARQYGYFQYLYEQEQKRSASIVAGAKIYIAFLVFILGSIFLKVITADNILSVVNSHSVPQWQKVLGFSLIAVSALVILLALVFSIFVLKVWSYDRLCNPDERLLETARMTSETEVLSKSICDFAVATSRNNAINNKRARYLSYALGCLLIGTVLSLISATTLNFIR
jgi:hypothetical protein